MIEDEIEALLYDENYDVADMYKYSLTPMSEKLHFKNGVAELPKAYKEPTEPKSVLEAKDVVYEVPIKSGECYRGASGIQMGQADKVQIEIPGITRPCLIGKQQLYELVKKYGGKCYEVEEDGKMVVYRCLSIDRATLLKYCECE